MRIDYLLTQSQLGLQVGFSAESGWLAVADEKYWPLEGKEVWKAAPLLECAPDEITARIAEVCAAASSTTPFPLLELLRSAFASHSSYWGERAAEWYPYIADEDKRRLSTVLRDVAQAKWATQRLRQFAQKEVRKLEI